MPWNYRVVRREYAHPAPAESEVEFGIHEAFYDAGSDVPHSITENAVTVASESIEALREELRRYETALGKPVLEWSAFDHDAPNTIDGLARDMAAVVDTTTGDDLGHADALGVDTAKAVDFASVASQKADK